MLSATALFEKFGQSKVLVIGDVMLDSYLWGSVTRISPEAPVPIVNVKSRNKTLGGAANVALNLKALGATVQVLSLIGTDADGDELLELFEQQGIGSSGVLKSDSRPTTVKHRIMSGSQQMLRVDAETDAILTAEEEQQLLQVLPAQLEGVSVVVFEDYDKGVLSDSFIKAVIAEAEKRKIPTVVDPKKRQFFAYSGATLFKPNLKELREGLGTDIQLQTDSLTETLKRAAAALHQQMPVQQLLLTLSEFGVFATDFQHHHHYPAHRREIADVSGAGDTVISVAALALAAGVPLGELAAMANVAGGLVCEHVGVVPIEAETLKTELLRLKLLTD